MPDMRSRATDALLATLQTLANGALELDPIARSRLTQLDGARLVIEPHELPEPLVIEVDTGTLTLAHTLPAHATAWARGPAAALAAMLRGRRAGGEVEVEGDEDALQSLGVILTGVRPELSKPLAAVLGRRNAETLASLVELGLDTSAALVQTALARSESALRENGHRRFLSQKQLDELIDATHRLEHRLGRLNARVDELAAREDPDRA